MPSIKILHSNQTALLDPTQSGFAHGFGLFETIKLAEGRLCFWEAHWNRMQASAEALNLKLTSDSGAALFAVRELVQVDHLKDGLIKLSLLREGAVARLFVYARGVASAPGSVQLKLDVRYPVNERSVLAGHKTHNYMENISLLEACRGEGFYDMIRVETLGHLAETTIGNIFFIIDGKLCTPSLETGILPGVIRGELLHLAHTKEGLFLPEVLKTAEAVFMTNSSCGILPVERIRSDGADLNFKSSSHLLIKELTAGLVVAEKENSVVL
jgi:branched-subunit amino acid aminotransferase/4-amino-4-deoxychorismate lyase